MTFSRKCATKHARWLTPVGKAYLIAALIGMAFWTAAIWWVVSR
jgi:hypothetical protein